MGGRLRERDIEDLKLRNHSWETQKRYQECVSQFARVKPAATSFRLTS